MCAVGGDPRGTIVHSAVEGNMLVYVRGGRGEMCVVVALSDASEVSWGGQ
jgi:hypothetical protein